MICVDGYKAFKGTMRIKYASGEQEKTGEWIYKPQYKCWYGKFPGAVMSCESIPANKCDIVEDLT